MKTKIFIFAMILMLLVSGCASLPDDSAIRQEAAAVLDGLIAGDYQTVRGGISQRVPDGDLKQAFSALSAEMASMETYEISLRHIQTKVQDGMKLTAIRYLVTAGSLRLHLDVTKVEGEPGLAGFHVGPAENAGPEEVSAGAMGWVFTGLGILAWGFVLWMVADCLCRKMKHKWLWLLMILLVWMVFSLSLFQGKASVHFNFGVLIGLSKLSVFANGSRVLYLYLPLGAISYFFTRKKLTIQPQEVPYDMDAL